MIKLLVWSMFLITPSKWPLGIRIGHFNALLKFVWVKRGDLTNYLGTTGFELRLSWENWMYGPPGNGIIIIHLHSKWINGILSWNKHSTKKNSLKDFNKAVKEDLLGQDVREIQGLVQEVLQWRAGSDSQTTSNVLSLKVSPGCQNHLSPRLWLTCDTD